MESVERRTGRPGSVILGGARSTEVVSPADAEATRAGYRLAMDYFTGEDPVFGRSEKTGLLVKRRGIDVCRYVSPSWNEVVNPSIFTARRAKVERLRAAIAEREDDNQWAEESMTEEDMKALKDVVVDRPPEPGHGRLPFFYKLYIVFKYSLVYLTSSKESREGVSYLAFPKFKLEGRRPIAMRREP